MGIGKFVARTALPRNITVLLSRMAAATSDVPVFLLQGEMGLAVVKLPGRA
jgi:hypothetical protein